MKRLPLNPRNVWRQYVSAWLALVTVTSCAHKSRFDEAGDEGDLTWSELIHEQLSINLNVVADLDDHRSFDVWLRHSGKSVAKDFVLARMAYRRGLQDLQPLGSGYYGKAKDARYFIARRNELGGDHKLYWMMVKVLSKKYGCFLQKRLRYGAATHFFCKDQRQIVFWKHIDRDWVEFFGRQYDRHGNEISVHNHRIAYTGRKLDAETRRLVASFGPQHIVR